MLIRASVLLALTWLCVALPARADEPLRYPEADVAPRWRERVARGPTRLPPDAVPLSTQCPSLPTLQREAQALVALKPQRTPAALKRIRAEAGDLVIPFLAVLGETRESAPKAAALFDAALDEVDYFLFAEKLALMCPRPHQVNPAVAPVIAVPQHPSYPSGHAGESAMLAAVGAALAPEAREALARLAKEVAFHRELAGVHYASDSAEGRRIGAAVAAAYLATPPPALQAAQDERARGNNVKHPSKMPATDER